MGTIWSHIKRYSFFVIAAITVCTLVFLALLFFQKNSHVHLVLRIQNRFFPNVVHLEKNQSLWFVNLTLHPTWPAAGPHPTHTTYPDFDVKEGITPFHWWAFTFTKEGTYTFHDHFAPEVSGIVISGANDLSQVAEESTCTSLSTSQEQAACMEIYFKNATNRGSFEEMKTLFEDIAIRYPGSCHTFAHDLGKSAFSSYLEHIPFDIGGEASSCGYGFWHGFTTAMQAYSGIEASREFCASLSGATDTLLHANRINCYHGIGIGLIPDPPPLNMWGEFQQLVDPALTFCDSISGDSEYREKCLTGVFHAMTVNMSKNLYGFAFNEDSLLYCVGQTPAHKRTCFYTLVAALPEFVHFDVGRTVAILEKTVPPELFNEVFYYAAIIFVNAEAPLDEAGHFVEQCGAINTDFRAICTSAVINKLYNNGTLGIEYQKAIAFCSDTWVLEIERSACFKDTVSHAVWVYSPSKVIEVCMSIPSIERSKIKDCFE